MKRIQFSLFVIVVCAIASWPAASPAASKVVIFHAGSLSVPFARIEKIFENLHPDIDIVREAGGSTKMARMIAKQGRSADIMASADFNVIDKNLIPDHADWNIRFATNQLVLCYTERSKFAMEVNHSNWTRILGHKGVNWGHSDPSLDPCGYRSLMVLQLAEKFYEMPGLYDRLIKNRPKENILPKAVQLVSLLKSGQLDYGWEYLSVAVQHGLRFVKLDDHINLGNYKYDDFYKQAAVKVTGKEEGTWITRVGKSCTYGVTITKSAPNRSGAELFLTYLLSPEGGLKILQEMGQPPFMPCRVSNTETLKRLPVLLQSKVEVQP